TNRYDLTVNQEPSAKSIMVVPPSCCSYRFKTGYQRLTVLAIKPVKVAAQVDPPATEMAFLGPKAEESIGCPVYALISNGDGIGTFVPLALQQQEQKYLHNKKSLISPPIIGPRSVTPAKIYEPSSTPTDKQFSIYTLRRSS
ncbi:hypothetical protein U9M48_029770, partial [Paspalum notatum var. saurae]